MTTDQSQTNYPTTLKAIAIASVLAVAALAVAIAPAAAQPTHFGNSLTSDGKNFPNF